jgi:glycosyltransferase involved in cell wall biosynthesis
MKVIHVSTSDTGGAGRAAFRIHKSLQKIGINSEMWVNVSNSGDKTVISTKGELNKLYIFLRRILIILLLKLLKTKNKVLHSISIFPSLWIQRINNSDADIINLHWCQHEMLSILDISKIKKPIVWTLHDMWAFCGAEHISWDSRWKNGYYKKNRPSHEFGLNFNRWTWLRKVKYWKKPMQIITPSKWLRNCVKQSKLMKSWPSKTIPNAIDVDFWKPINKYSARHSLNLPQKSYIVAFGSSNANEEPHKGFDLLLKALQKIEKENLIKLHLIIFGQKKKQKKTGLTMPVYNAGYLNDTNLKKLYNAVDAVIVPSRLESFGQIACEASACETPVISFDTSGLKDIIKHRLTGYLAKKFDTEDLSFGIKWVLKNSKIKQLGYYARKYVINNFNKNLIAKKYLETYLKVLKY